MFWTGDELWSSSVEELLQESKALEVDTDIEAAVGEEDDENSMCKGLLSRLQAMKAHVEGQPASSSHGSRDQVKQLDALISLASGGGFTVVRTCCNPE